MHAVHIVSQDCENNTHNILYTFVEIERKFEMAVPYSSIQHNLDTSTSGSENGDESGGEDVVEGYLPRDEDIRPYMFEPETDNSHSSSDEEDGARGGDGGGRLENLDWCQCGHCVIMPTARECRCCTEVPQVQNRMEEEGAGCITTHPGFHGICLDVWSLRTAYYGYRQQYGENAREGSLPEKYRHVAYRQIVRFCWEFVGKDVRVVIPACAVNKIRDTFPSERYEGFRLPRL